MMPGLRIHQDRVVESELRDAGGDLRDLRVGVRPRIAGVRNEFVERPVLDALGHGMRKHNYPSKSDLGGSFGRCADGASLAN